MAPHDEYNIEDAVPEVSDTEEGKTVKLQVRFHGYTADDIQVRPHDCDLHILSRDNRVLKTFHLPESVDPFTVEAKVVNDGCLLIEAPLVC